MAYISNKERESFIKRINKSYTFRKILIICEIILLFGFILIAFISLKYADQETGKWMWWDYQNNKFSILGICMFSWAMLMAVLGIITIVLVLTFNSPRTTAQQVTYLESSPISGKKIKKSQTASQIMKPRTTSKKKSKK